MIDQNLQPTIDLDSSSPSEFDSGFPAKPKYVNNPNRKKREAKINPDYEAAIIKILYKYRNRRNGLTTKSAVVEHIFENKSFTKSESDKQVSSINSHMTGYKTQCEQLYEFYINLATKDKIPETREEVIALAKNTQRTIVKIVRIISCSAYIIDRKYREHSKDRQISH